MFRFLYWLIDELLALNLLPVQFNLFYDFIIVSLYAVFVRELFSACVALEWRYALLAIIDDRYTVAAATIGYILSEKVFM